MKRTADVDARRSLLDPVRFARGWLRQDVWDVQAAILAAIDSDRRIAVKACHASGKSRVAAIAALWWVSRFADGIVVTTAPTWEQVVRVLWGEVKKVVGESRLSLPPLNQTELRLGPNNYAIGLSTNEGVRFQGFHGRLLIILDEAPGVKPEIYEAIEGIRAGGDVRILALGNPTVASGPFYDAFTSNRAGWRRFTISAFDTPNLAGLTVDRLLALDDDCLDENPRPYLVTRRWVAEKHVEWGPGHPLWASRVLGEFPAQSDDALISLAWLEEASRRPPAPSGGKVSAGLDVAGPGEDETVLAVVDGGTVLSLTSWSKSDPRGEVAAALEPYRKRLQTVNVDSAGIGYFLGKHLQDLGFPARLVNVGRSASDAERYVNLKAEFYWGMRSRFSAGEVAGLTDDLAIAQLAGILYRHDARGRVVIESKDEARRRGVKSPDRAEALMLAFARPALAWQTLDTPDSPAENERPDPIAEQLQSAFPEIFSAEKETETCARCAFATAGDNGAEAKAWCSKRRFRIKLSEQACAAWEPGRRRKSA